MGQIEHAVEALRAGELVVIPTDTVYGVAVRPEGVGSLFEAKQRPAHKPVAILGADVEQLTSVATFDGTERAVADRYWPGPLTLVLPRTSSFGHDLGGAADTVGVRVPDCKEALEVLRLAGPLAVTSANRSGEDPASTVDEARAALGDAVAAYVDGGRRSGLPSTVVSLVGEPNVLREGAVGSSEIIQALTS